MERMTGGLVGSTGLDNLIAKLNPSVDSFLVELKTAGAYKRGTVLSLESDGTYEVLGSGSGKARAIIADDTEATDGTAVAYRSGHFNRLALIVAEGYELTAEDEDELRIAGIFLSDAAYTPAEDAGDSEDSEGKEEAKTYTEAELNAMTIDQIKALASEQGYTITKTAKAEIIAEFLAAQGE